MGVDKILREIAVQHELGQLTYLEFKERFMHRLAEVTEALALISLAAAIADFDDHSLGL